MSDETRKIVNLVGTSAQFSSGGGRKGLAGHDTDLGSWKCQLDASGNFAVYARRDAAQTFTGLQTFNAGVTVAGGASRFSGLAGTGVRMATFAADGTLSVATDATTARSLIGALAESEKGSANGVAPLGSDSKIAATYLPSYVDDVIEVTSYAVLPGTGETGKIYVTLATNKTYRWSGSAYVEISASLALGETSSTAYRGDLGKTAYNHSQITAANPHGTTFAQLASKPTTLSGYGIMDAQPLDSDLTAIAALSTQAFGRSLLTQADAAAARTAIEASDGKELLNWFSSRPSDCNLAANGNGGLRRFFASAGIANGPSTNWASHVLHIGHDATNGYDTQLASELSTGALRSRAQCAGVWGDWNTVWDSVNLPASATGKNLLNVADAAAARTAIGAQGYAEEYDSQTIAFTSNYNSPISPVHTFSANFFSKNKTVRIAGRINSGDLGGKHLKFLVDGASSFPFYTPSAGEQVFLFEIFIKCLTAPSSGNVDLLITGRITSSSSRLSESTINASYAVGSAHTIGISVDNAGASGSVGCYMWTVEQLSKGA